MYTSIHTAPQHAPAYPQHTVASMGVGSYSPRLYAKSCVLGGGVGEHYVLVKKGVGERGERRDIVCVMYGIQSTENTHDTVYIYKASTHTKHTQTHNRTH